MSFDEGTVPSWADMNAVRIAALLGSTREPEQCSRRAEAAATD
jgi:hypothetical protein